MQKQQNELKRDLKTPGAILMGLGSIIGTGIFVSVAIAMQVAGIGISYWHIDSCTISHI